MIQISLAGIGVTVAALSLFVWRARPHNPINQHFAAATLPVAVWVLGLVGTNFAIFQEAGVRASFIGASLIPCAFLAFVNSYPVSTFSVVSRAVPLLYGVGLSFACLSSVTNFVAYDASTSPLGLTRKTGALYPLFAGYCVTVLATALILLIAKWRRATGLARLQLQYLGVGAILAVSGAVTTNLVLPFLTTRSTYAWLGPYFLFPFVALVAHAIIRHRLMDLRLVIHRGLTFAFATVASLLPIGVLLALLWPRITSELEFRELLTLVAAIVSATLLVPPTKDLVGRFLDKYVYRTETNFRLTVRQASRRLTRFLDLATLLSLISDSVTSALRCEGVAIYLKNVRDLELVRVESGHWASRHWAPKVMSALIVNELTKSKDAVVADEIARSRDTDSLSRLHDELTRLNWALVLPLLSEDSVIGAIVVGPKLSGDPFYPHDIDLLMTLANQAGIAIKNAQLYTEVVLANEYIENIVATIESGVVAINASGQVTRFNRAAAQLTGLAADDVVGRSVATLPEVLAGRLRATLADGQPRTEPEVALPGGVAARPVICTTSSLRDPAGEVLGAVAVFSDLTPLKELEAERRRVERLAYFEILASSIAHEIKNPLVAIKTFAQLIPRRHADEQFVDEFSRVVTREIGRMERLVERLRTLARPSDRPKQRIDLGGPLGDAVEFLRPVFEEKRITVTVNLGEPPRAVIGDVGELESLFLNLLMNAFEATPPDGAVAVQLTAGTDQFLVTVADSGPGIPPELVDHVFDPFITTKPRGSGLGLTICAGIVAAHRAKLRAANRPAGGALFTVEFPNAVPSEAPIAHENRPARHGG